MKSYQFLVDDIVDISSLRDFPEEYADSGIQISENFSLILGDHLEETNFFNHSCSPNAGINGQIFLVAMRDISIGEEVNFDYAMCLHKAVGVDEYNFKCGCGSTSCRKNITENDWKSPQLQEKYKGYFQYFLQEKINK